MGIKTTYKGGIFTDDMTAYVNKIEIATVNTAEDSPLQDSKLSGFSSSRHATEVDSTFRHARVPLQDT